MRNKPNTLAALALLLISAPMAANAVTPVGGLLSCPSTSSTYQFFSYDSGDDKSWDAASAFAQSLFSTAGVQGHLATLTTPSEDACVDLHRSNLGLGQGWIGGFQPDGEAAPGDGWEWVNGEGMIPGVDSPVPNYANWGNNFAGSDVEPNDAGGPGGTGVEDNNENDLAHGRYGLGGGWNDEGVAVASLIDHFVVEFEDGTDDFTDCIAGVGTCNTTGIMPFEVEIDPDDVPPPGSVFTQGVARQANESIAWCDPRVNQATNEVEQVRSLDVGAEFPGGDFAPGELIIDETLFGCPCMAFIKSSIDTFELPNGALLRSILQADELAGKLGNICGGDEIPNYMERIQWGVQTDSPADMVEGALAALTHERNSPSRGGVWRGTVFGLNTREAALIDFEAPGGVQLVLDFMKERARAKFDALKQVLQDTKKIVRRPKHGDLMSAIDNAKAAFLGDDFDGSLGHLAVLGDLCESIVLRRNSTRNVTGECIARKENLEFRVAEIKAE